MREKLFHDGQRKRLVLRMRCFSTSSVTNTITIGLTVLYTVMRMEYVVYWNCTFKQFPNAVALIPGQVMSDLRTRDARKIENTMTLITIFPF